MVAVRMWWHFWRGWGLGHGERWYGSPQEPYRPSASNPATAISIFPKPFISSHCASSLSTLTFFSRSKPWKNGIHHKDQAQKIRAVIEWVERLNHTRYKGYTSCNNLCTSSSASAGTPPISIHDLTTSRSHSSFITSLASSSLHDSSAGETNTDMPGNSINNQGV